MKTKFTFFVFTFFTSFAVFGQSTIFVDTSYTVPEMVSDFFGDSCGTYSNITFSGDPSSIGFYDAGANPLGAQAGIVMSTGSVMDLPGNDATELASSSFSGPGDPSLDILSGFPTKDACILEFDVLATTDQFNFVYVFASEEYNEWVNTGFNDVFGFFISGPNMPETNVAVLPGTTTPITINTINLLSNSNYYIDNEGNTNSFFKLDGYTTPLPAPVSVVPGETYHFKLVIADASDGVLDSHIFLGIESMCGDSTLQLQANYEPEVSNMTVAFKDETKYATSWFWEFGDGETSYQQNPVHTYATDGLYSVSLTTENFCCSNTLTQDVQIGTLDHSIEQVFPSAKLFPNPVNDQIFLEGFEGEINWMLLDAKGQVIRSGVIMESGTLEVEELPRGLYFLNLTGVEGMFSQKIYLSN